jgi:hypothetical protein
MPCGVSYCEPISTVFDLLDDITDLINSANFHVDRSTGYRLTGA